MTAFIGGKRYSTDKAKVIAHDAVWDGTSEERDGRNQFLFKTEDGSYFVQYRTNSTDCFQPAHDWVQPVTQGAPVRSTATERARSSTSPPTSRR